MQIIINQAQIEEAINQYMLKKINLNAGSAFEIEIAATRGAGGFTATINIVEDAPKAVIAEPVKRTVIAKPQNVATEKQKELPLEEAVPEVSASPEVVADAAQPPEEAAKPAPVKRQLFGSLTKPVNS